VIILPHKAQQLIIQEQKNHLLPLKPVDIVTILLLKAQHLIILDLEIQLLQPKHLEILITQLLKVIILIIMVLQRKENAVLIKENFQEEDVTVYLDILDMMVLIVTNAQKMDIGISMLTTEMELVLATGD